MQKVYFPYDVDIIREQQTMGLFKKEEDAAAALLAAENAKAAGEDPELKGTDTVSSDSSARRRPIYPPSVATHNRAQNGSDGTNYTGHMRDRHSHDLSREVTQELSNDMMSPQHTLSRPSIDRPRPSYDRMRMSMDAMRPSTIELGLVLSRAMILPRPPDLVGSSRRTQATTATTGLQARAGST